MKKFLTLALVTGLTVSNVYCQYAGQGLISKANKLRTAYKKVLGTSNKASSETNFFKEFPNTFNELNALYGFNNDTPAVLYNDASKHILEVFNELKSINDTLYYRKIIGISIGGKWDADAINYFQDGLQKHVTQNTTLTCYILKQLPENDIRSFWYFYFDSPHPKENLESDLMSIEQIDSVIFKYLIEEHKKVVADWREH